MLTMACKYDVALSVADTEYLPALFAEKLNIAVDTVKPLSNIGNVYTFEVTPTRRHDPVLIWAKGCDLRFYYYLWGRNVQSFYRFERDEKALLGSCDEAIKAALDSFSGTEQECRYLAAELLNWKNWMRKG